jgi:hypothetical protein
VRLETNMLALGAGAVDAGSGDPGTYFAAYDVRDVAIVAIEG